MTAWMHETLSARSAQVALGVASGVGFALLAYLLMGRDVGPTQMFPYQDKVLHFLAFAGVTAPAVLALPRRYWMFWLSHMVLVAVGTEYFQGLVYAERTASVWDALADIAGIATAAVICGQIRRAVVARQGA